MEEAPHRYAASPRIGLDDYPRAETPSQQEEHVDLLSWMMFFARTMADISELLGHNPALYTDTYRRLETQLQGILPFLSP